MVKRIYQITRILPNDEKFGLVSQMWRAAISIPSNIAEGQARHTTGEVIQFVSHAEGSLGERDTQLVFAVELGYCSDSEVTETFELISDVRHCF